MNHCITVLGAPTVVIFEPWADELNLAKGQKAVIEFDSASWSLVWKVSISADLAIIECLGGALVLSVEVDGETWQSPITQMPAM